MAVDRNRIADLLKQLPEELQGEVFEFAESLLQKSRIDPSGSRGKGTPSVRAFFGIWDSGNPRSGDNDRIGADLAREYASSHEADT
jgi:hypothetical protein